MDSIRLNYKYRYPRIMFKNGESRYGIICGIYNKSKQKLEYYFADASDLRKITAEHKELAYNAIKKLRNKVKFSDILRVDYLN